MYSLYISANDEVNIKNSKLTAKGGGQLHPGEDTSTGGGTGISLFAKGKVVVGEGSEVIAIGGDDKTVKRSAWGGAALRFYGTGVGCGYEVQKGGKLTAIGGNAESKSGVVTGGDALWGEKGGIVSAGETTLIGGNAKSGSGKATGGNASFYNGDSNQVTVKGGTTTALGGKAEGADGKATNGSSIKTILNGKIGLSVSVSLIRWRRLEVAYTAMLRARPPTLPSRMALRAAKLSSLAVKLRSSMNRMNLSGFAASLSIRSGIW